MFHFIAEKLDENDVLLRTDCVVKHAQNDEVHFFDFVTSENRVDLAFHPGLHLTERKNRGSVVRFQGEAGQ